ncbi:MAG: hypothetical protein AAF626_16965 [Pseudomonadota bacterium]
MRSLVISVALTWGLVAAQTATAATMTTDRICGPTEVSPKDDGLLGITRCDAVTTIEGITVVVLSGLGPDQTFSYPSLADAPGPADQGSALADALDFFGFPSAQPIAASTLSLFDTVVGPLTQSRTVSLSPDAVVVGDLNSDASQFFVIAGRVDLEFTDSVDITNRYRLSVDLAQSSSGPTPPSPTPIPLPATAPLLVFGLGGLVALRRTSRGAK